MSFHQIPSMLTDIFKLQISPMRLPIKSEGHRCLKYQNAPYIRKFWHIGKPWERFQCWVRRIYFLTVPDDHTVIWWLSLSQWRWYANMMKRRNDGDHHKCTVTMIITATMTMIWWLSLPKWQWYDDHLLLGENSSLLPVLLPSLPRTGSLPRLSSTWS